MDWQPIATAPKDGEWLLLWMRPKSCDVGWEVVGRWNGAKHPYSGVEVKWASDSEGWEALHDIIYWMYLPPKPKGEERAHEDDRRIPDDGEIAEDWDA